MQTEINFGNLIHPNNKIARYTTITFENIESLEKHWQENRESKSWQYNISVLKGELMEWVDASHYFNQRVVSEEE